MEKAISQATVETKPLEVRHWPMQLTNQPRSCPGPFPASILCRRTIPLLPQPHDRVKKSSFMSARRKRSGVKRKPGTPNNKPSQSLRTDSQDTTTPRQHTCSFEAPMANISGGTPFEAMMLGSAPASSSSLTTSFFPFSTASSINRKKTQTKYASKMSDCLLHGVPYVCCSYDSSKFRPSPCKLQQARYYGLPRPRLLVHCSLVRYDDPGACGCPSILGTYFNHAVSIQTLI